MTTIRKIILGTALAASAVTVAAPASARDYYGHHDNDAATAIVGGVIGLALGAAIASSSHHDRYDDYRYRHAHRHHDRYDGYRGSQYDNRYYGNGYNGSGYYNNGYNSGYGYQGYNGYGY